jgi:competence protein ComEC
MWSSFCVSLSAMAGVSPVIALYFGTFSLAGIAANLPVVFFSNLAMFASLPLFLFHGFAGLPASLFGMSSWLFAKLTLFFTLLFSHVPMASIEVRPDMFEAMVFYLTLGVALVASGRRAWGAGVIAILFGMNLVLWHDLFRPKPAPPSVVTVNLGKEMALLFSSGSETVLIDAGRKRGAWERVRRQADTWGFAAPTAAVRFQSPDSIIGTVPVSRRLDASGRSLVLSSVVVTRIEEKTVRIDSRRHSMLLVSGMERLLNVQGQQTDLLVLWMYRFTGKQWRELDMWLQSSRPRRVLIVQGPFMTAAQKVLLQRFAAARPGVEVRSKSAQTVWP